MLCGVGGELKRCSSVECVHGATPTKSLQGLGLLEVVDVLEVVGEQMVKVVLRRKSKWYVVGWEGKRPNAVVECSGVEECEECGGPVSAGRVEWEVGVEVEVGDGVGGGCWPSWSESWIGTCPTGNCLRSWPAPTKHLGGRTHPG